MLRAHRYGALCTLSLKFDGHPFGSITPYLLDHDGSLLIFISTLAEHTKNIQHDPRVSLITHNQDGPHIQAQGRVTVVGKAQLVAEREQVGMRYLRYFPEAKTYLGMHDFSFYRIVPAAIRYIGGFGKIHWIDMAEYAPREIGAYIRQEAQLIDAFSAEQQDKLRQLLQQRHGVSLPEVQVIGLDCDGLDVSGGEKLWRIDFSAELSDPAQAVAVLHQPD